MFSDLQQDLVHLGEALAQGELLQNPLNHDDGAGTANASRTVNDDRLLVSEIISFVICYTVNDLRNFNGLLEQSDSSDVTSWNSTVRPVHPLEVFHGELLLVVLGRVQNADSDLDVRSSLQLKRLATVGTSLT